MMRVSAFAFFAAIAGVGLTSPASSFSFQSEAEVLAMSKKPTVQTTVTAADQKAVDHLSGLTDLVQNDIRDITQAALARGVSMADFVPQTGGKPTVPNTIYAIAPKPDTAAFFIGRVAVDSPNAGVYWLSYCRQANGTWLRSDLGDTRPSDLAQLSNNICSASL